MLDETLELLGAPIVSLDVASDRPIANLAVRLCDVHSTGESLRVSYGVQNLTHRDGHETPMPLTPGQRYRIRIQLNDTGSVFPPGHRIRLALSTTYWPMIWPSPEKATLTVFGGTLDLPVRPRQNDALDEALSPLPEPQTAMPEQPTTIRPGVVRIERLGLELGTEGEFAFDIKEDDPLSAVAEMRRTLTKQRDAWQVRIETHMRLSCTRDAFLLRASVRAWEGAREVCRREWDRSIPRDLV